MNVPFTLADATLDKVFLEQAEEAQLLNLKGHRSVGCLLYTSDAADEEDSVDLGGRRIINKKKKEKNKTESE